MIPTSVCWSLGALGDAIAALADRARVPYRKDTTVSTPPELEMLPPVAVARWVEQAADAFDLETFHAEIRGRSLERALRLGAPMLMQVPARRPSGFLAVLGCSRRTAELLGPDHTVLRVPARDLYRFLREPHEARFARWVDTTLADISAPARRLERARDQLLAHRLRSTVITIGWSIRPAPGGSLLHRGAQLGLVPRVLALGLTHLLVQLAWILAWILLGRAVFESSVEMEWLTGSAAILLSIVPLRLLSSWAQAVVTVSAAGLIKTRLLQGALRLDPDEVRQRGSGELIGRAMEAGAFESMAVEGVFLLLLAAIELVAAAVIVVLGASGLVGVAALLLWGAGFAATMLRYRRELRRWTRLRVAMTRDLVENMIGYRTRLVQQPRERWHEGEDRQLREYLDSSGRLDHWFAILIALPRFWLVLGVAALIPDFVTGSTSTSIAISIGGALFAFQALRRLVTGALGLIAASMAFEEIAPLITARRGRVVPPPFLSTAELAPGEPTLELRDMSYRYGRSGPLVLDACSVLIPAGARILLEGPSGSGKSTLAAIMAGLQQADSGLLLYRGLDRETLGGAAWRRAITLAPQFHANHVFSGTFLFNLLLGAWPPDAADKVEALAVCHELGLGPLIARMPSGLQQYVGETGWQLSHGERSRLYIARALLQRSEVVILDESMGALDPETLVQTMECVRRRARTLIVVAHP